MANGNYGSDSRRSSADRLSRSYSLRMTGNQDGYSVGQVERELTPKPSKLSMAFAGLTLIVAVYTGVQRIEDINNGNIVSRADEMGNVETIDCRMYQQRPRPSNPTELQRLETEIARYDRCLEVRAK